MRVGNYADHVEYCKDDNGTLTTTYYLSVYGYTYASYSIIARVKREGQGLTDAEKRKASATHLYESISHQQTLHDEYDAFIGYFDF